MKIKIIFLSALTLAPFLVSAQVIYDAQGKPLHYRTPDGIRPVRLTDLLDQSRHAVKTPYHHGASSDPLGHLSDPLKQQPKPEVPIMRKDGLQPVKCELNMLPKGIEGTIHLPGHVWICTYTDAAGRQREFYVPQYHSNDTIKLYYHDLEASGGRGMLYDPRTHTLTPPPASTVFHGAVLAREIKRGNVLMPDGKPLNPNLLSLERKGSEPWISGDILGRGVTLFELPDTLITTKTKPVTGQQGGISFNLLAPNAPAAAMPTSPLPNQGGLGTKPTQTLQDIFANNVPFNGGFSIHITLLTIKWQSGPLGPTISDDGKALMFFMGFNEVPFATIITDVDKNHKYEAHIVRFEFDESEKNKKNYMKDWSKIKPIEEFATYEDFTRYVNNLPQPKPKK